jgi:hypothetical protein
MPQTISPQQQRTREEYLQAEADTSSEDSPARGASEERYQHHASPSGGIIGVVCERFLQMPVAVVLAVLWVAGMALVSACVLRLYMFWTSLA